MSILKTIGKTRFRARINTLKEDPATFWTDQFNNTDALNGYRNIGVELLQQVESIDAFCGAVVEGTAPGFVPPHLTPADYDEARAIDEEEAREMARRLAREEGIFAGVSTGLNVVAALQLASELGAGRSVVTVAVDSGLKYLAGDLFNARG